MNLVDCKLCNKEFDYSPGNAGNARQLCDACRNTVDEEELQKLEEESVVENNRYMCHKLVYDPVDILVDGNIPIYNNDGDRFVCAKEMGQFINKTGITGMADGVVKFLKSLPLVHRVIFCQEISEETLAILMNMAHGDDLIVMI